jgi:hypothetical protein
MMHPVGHNVYLTVVESLPGMARSFSLEKLHSLSLSLEQARARAVENLGKLFQAGGIHAMQFPNGPEGKPFILIGGTGTPLLARSLRIFLILPRAD